MYSSLSSIIVFLFIQGGDSTSHHVFKRSPQQIDIQSIRQKQISPDITVVDVVVNEPTRKQFLNQQPYIAPVNQQGRYPANNFYPNNPYLNPPRRQPEIQIIEVVDPSGGNGVNTQQWQGYPDNRRGEYPYNNGAQTGILVIPSNSPGRFPDNRGNQFFPRPPGRPNRRPFRPNTDFYIREDESFDDFTERPRDRHPGHRGHRRRPRPDKNNKNSKESSEEEDEKYVFDAGETTITPDNFPIIPLNKNDIRK